MATFYSLKVKDVKQETKNASSIYFEIPEDLKEIFSYKHGQYLTLKLNIEGKNVNRAYSLCTSPYVDPYPAVTSKRVEGGLVSNYLNDHIKPGDEIQVFPPLGKFTSELNANRQQSYVLIAGGSGITPMMSILKSVLDQEPASMIFLLYGNLDEESIIFKNELEHIKEKFGDRIHIEHTLSDASDSWQGERGILNQDKCLELLEKNGIEGNEGEEFFICGPSPMMEAAKQALTAKNVPDDKVHIEYFTAPLPDLNKSEEAIKEEKGIDDSNEDFDEADVEILLDGETHHIKVGKNEKILEAAQENDIDPPYACQMGICTTCKAYMHEGKVEMEENEGLTDSEIEEGYILTCQSMPRTSRVKVEYE